MPRYEYPRIGYAESAERNGRADRHGIVRISADGRTLTVRYEGYREGTAVIGLPLNSRHQWRWNPAPIECPREWFAVIHLFNQEEQS